MHGKVRELLQASLFIALVGAAGFGCGGDEGSPSAGGGLTTPANLKAELVPGPALHVTWTDTANEQQYILERKVGAAGEWKAIQPPINFNITQYHDADVATGSYSYRIAAGALDGTKSAFSSEVTAVVP